MKQILLALLLISSQASAYWMYENQGTGEHYGVPPGERLLVEETSDGYLYQYQYKTYGPGYTVNWIHSTKYVWNGALVGLTETVSFQQDGHEKVTNTTATIFSPSVPLQGIFNQDVQQATRWVEDADGDVFSDHQETRTVRHTVKETDGVYTWAHGDVSHYIWGEWSTTEIHGNAHFVLVASGNGDFDNDGIPDDDDDDADGDGIGNAEDGDWDNDGVSNDAEVAAGSDPNDPREKPGDLDGDGIPDSQDDDIDGDGIPNNEEEPEDIYRNPNPGKYQGSAIFDEDGDGIPDVIDKRISAKNEDSPPLSAGLAVLALLAIIGAKRNNSAW